MKDHIIINIGRQFGSGGKLVAEALGRRLGIPVYDNELITKAAEQSGFSPDLFRRRDEKKRNFNFLGLIGGESGYKSVLGDAELFRIQSDVIRNLAQEGSAIFVGRASDYVLRDMDCINVFITAPDEARVELVSEREGISPEEARIMIDRRDRGRADFYNFFTLKNWGVASNYDICIDRTILGNEGTADFIIEFGKRRGLI